MRVQLVSKGELSLKRTIRKRPRSGPYSIFTGRLLDTFELYYGSTSTNSLPRPDMPFTSSKAIHLCYELKKKATGDRYCLLTDRYDISHCLANELLNENIHITGTVSLLFGMHSLLRYG